jgi:hypothetical protein
VPICCHSRNHSRFTPTSALGSRDVSGQGRRVTFILWRTRWFCRCVHVTRSQSDETKTICRRHLCRRHRVRARPVSAAGAGTGGSSGKPGGRGGKSCTRKTPAVSVDNSWAWGAPGSDGIHGQQFTYAIAVIDYDVVCRSSRFVVGVSAPSGFSVSLPTSTISLRSSSSGYLWAYVTSPSLIADGDYPLVVTVRRSGSSENASTTSWYKVCSSDSVKPTLFWPSPGDGARSPAAPSTSPSRPAPTMSSGRSTSTRTEASTPVSTTACDDV